MDSSQAQQRVQTVCLVMLATIAVATALSWLSPVLIPFVLAVFLSIGLAPVVAALVRHLHVPRSLAAIITLLLCFALLGGLGLLVSRPVAELTSNAEAYQQRLQEFFHTTAAALPLERFGINPQASGNFLNVSAETVTGVLVKTTGVIVNVLSNGALVFVFLCFLLFGGTAHERPIDGVWGEIVARIKRYIVTKMLLSVLTGVLVGVALWILGVKPALVFALLAFLLNFIPTLGSIIATVLPLPVVLMSPGASVTTAVLAVAVPGAIQVVLANVVDPKVMGKSFDLHPIVIIMALMCWGMLWGIIGMFLAVPMTSLMKILLEKHEPTRPIAELLAGRIDALSNPAREAGPAGTDR